VHGQRIDILLFPQRGELAGNFAFDVDFWKAGPS